MKKLFAVFATLLGYTTLVAPAFAQAITVAPCPKGSDFTALCNISSQSLPTVIYTVIVILLIAAVIICVFYLIWGGIKWILSGGDKAKVDSARQHIIAAIVGLIVAFLAFFIVNVVFQIFTGHALTGLTLPSLGGGPTPTCAPGQTPGNGC